jgi:hypothetical protein
VGHAWTILTSLDAKKKLALYIGDMELPTELTGGHGIDETPLAPGREETRVKDLG